MNGPRPSRQLFALVAALAFAASAFGGLVLPRLADAELPASLKTPAATRIVPARPSTVRQKLDDGLCQERHRLRQVRAHRPDWVGPGV